MSSHRPHPPVAVTGIGCVTALGGDAAATWEAVYAGRSARGPLTAIAVEGCRVTEGAQAPLPDWPAFPEKQLGRLSRATRLALPAAREALAQAALLDDQERCVLPRLEMSVSTTACGMEKGEEFLRTLWSGIRTGQSARVAHYQSQAQIGVIHDTFGFDGPVM
ncbi:MAG: beta-ketoacyl synthase N-terminal-like domain-containing protein, partial [Chthoniobacterales bacterium]